MDTRIAYGLSGPGCIWQGGEAELRQKMSFPSRSLGTRRKESGIKETPQVFGF